MALSDRSIDLIVRANIDQAGAPLDQLVQKINSFVAALDRQRQAAQEAGASEADYAKVVKATEAIVKETQVALGQLLTTRGLIDNLPKLQQTVDQRQEVVNQRAQRLGDARVEGKPTAGLERSLEASSAALARANDALQQRIALLERIGVLEENLSREERQAALDRANASISNVALTGVDTLQQARQLAAATTTALVEGAEAFKQQRIEADKVAAAQEEAARFAQTIRKEVQLAAAEEAKEIERVRTLGAARQAAVEEAARQNAPQTIATQSVTRADIEAAFAAQDAAEKQAKVSQDAAEKYAKVIEEAQRAITRFVIQETARQAQAEQDAADKAGKAAEDHAKIVERAQQAISRLVIQEAARRAQAEQDALDKAAKAAEDHAKVVERAQQAIARFVIQEDNKAAVAKADEAAATVAKKTADEAVRRSDAEKQTLDTIRQIAAAQRVADQSLIRSAAAAPSGVAPAPTISSATTPEAAQARLAALPGPGTGDLASLQAEVERLRVAMSKGGEGAAVYRKAFQDLDDVVRQLETDLNDAAVAARRRQSEIISDVSKPVAVAPQTATQQVSTVLQGRTAGQPIDDTSAAIDALTASMGKGSLTAETYNKVMDQVFAIQRRLAEDAGLIDSFERQAAAVRAASAAYEKANADLTRLIAAEKSGTVSVQQLQQATARLDTAATNLTQQIAQQAQLDAQLKARRIDTANLTAETEKLVAASRRLTTAQEGIQKSSGKAFGLSAFQFQNLQFQVNDVITQLSLGQGVLRTFEAQAGQIFQIFDLSIAQMKQLAIVGVPAAAAIGLVVLALERVAQTQAASRGANALFAGTVDAATHSTAALVALERELEHLGLSFSDARKAAEAFGKQGLDDAHIRQFATAARNLAQGSGTDIADAIQKLSAIPTGDPAQLNALLREYGLLSPAIAQYIIDQTNAGRADLARQATIDALATRFAEMRKAQVGPLDQAFIDLKNSWNAFLDAIGSEGVFSTLINTLKSVLEGVTKVVKGLEDIAKNLNDITNNKLFQVLGGAASAVVKSNPALAPTAALFRLGSQTGGTRLEDANKQVTTLQNTIDETQKKIDDLLRDRPNLAGSGFIKEMRAQVTALQDALDKAIASRDKLTAQQQTQVRQQGGDIPTVGASPLPSQFANLPKPDSRVSAPIPTDIVPVIAKVASLTATSVDDINALYRNEARRLSDGSFAPSSTGAQGPFQLMPDTFRELFAQQHDVFQKLADELGKRLPADPMQAIKDIDFNALAGALYFRLQTEKFGNNPALGAAAYNTGPGNLQQILNNQKTLPAETAQYVANFQARQQTGNNFRPPTTGLQTGGPTQQAGEQTVALREIDQRIAALQANPELKGTSAAKIEQDNTIATEALTKAIQDEQKRNPTVNIGPGTREGVAREDQTAVRRRLEDENNIIRQRQAETRQREQAEIDQEAASLGNPTTIDPTDVIGKQRQAFEAFNSKLAALNKLIAQGAVPSGTSVDELRQKIIQERDNAVREAGTAAERAAVTAAVADRTSQQTALAEQFKTGAITIEEAFQRLTAIISTTGPKIKAAVEASNASLQAAPQTAKTQADLAANAKVDVSGRAAFEQFDFAAERKIDDLLKARKDDLDAVNFQVRNGVRTQRDADAEQTRIYAKYHDQITDSAASLQKLIDLQRDNGLIGADAYAKISAAIGRATVEADALTDSQRKFNQALDRSIIGNAEKAFDTIAEAIGNAVAGTGTWSDAIKSLGVAFAQFAASVLKDLAKILLEEQLLAAVQAARKASSEGAGFIGAVASGASALFGGSAASGSAATSLGTFYHSGGVVGAPGGVTRMVDVSVFNNAVRMHSGGLAGIQSDEVAAILQKGETVRTKTQESSLQTALAKGGGSPIATSIRNILVIDPNDISAAMANPSGEQVILNVIKRNSQAVRQLVGGR